MSWRGAAARGAAPRAPLRRRLAVYLVGMAIGSLALAVVVTTVLTRSAARTEAAADLRDAADGLSRLAGLEALVNLSRRLGRVLDVDEVGVVLATPAGQVVAGRALASLPRRDAEATARKLQGLLGLPPGILPADLDGAALWAGTVQSGRRGRLVFVAHPLAQLPAGSARPVVVLTRQVGVLPLGRNGGLLLAAVAVAAAVAAGVAVGLARRLTRPLAAMERAARAIAAGDLHARVEGVAGADHELAALAEAIDSMAADLERGRSLERAFLMSVSHDLRTPLTSIRGYAEAIADGAADDDESRRRAAAIIGTEARRLERLVGDLLDLARLDAREFSLRPLPVDVAEVVGAVVESHQPAAREAGVSLAWASSGSTLPAVTDPDRLAQVVSNLVENALRYARAGVLVAAVGGQGGGVRISVTDDGPGIDPHDLPRVFERLYTAGRQPGRRVGTGLGLAIVAQLVAAMGGSIEASPSGAGGTRFSFDIPDSMPGPPGRRTWPAGQSAGGPGDG